MTTIFGWDASVSGLDSCPGDHDHRPGHPDLDLGGPDRTPGAGPGREPDGEPVDLVAAVRHGIVFTTHLVCEGARFYRDPRYALYAARAHGVIPLAGAYAVNHPGDQRPQVDWFIALLDQQSPWWRTGPFLVQLDAEKFDYMSRAPSPAECQQWCDYFVDRTGGTHRPVLYAPRWLYGDTMARVGYPLWASDYGGNPVASYRQAYPGDAAGRWAAYSGRVPAILQYGSRLTIGSQHGCDANAFRGELAQLIALVGPGATPPPAPAPVPTPSDWTTEIIMALPTLSRGASGQPVRNLQGLLGANGHPTTVDGAFGPNTEAGVRAFQQRRGLSVDGVAGRHTWTTLITGKNG